MTVTLGATDTGGSGLKATYWKIDSGDVQTYAADNKPVLSSSAQTLTYWSVDNAGNKEDDNTLQVQIDTIAPTTTATPSASGWTNGDVTVTLAATDTGGSGLKATYWKIDSGDVQTYATDSKPVLSSSAQTLTYWSVDNAGNKEDDNTLQVQIDRTLPQIGDNITQPWYTGTVNVQLTATDSGSGVATFAYTLGDPNDPATVWMPYTAPFAVSGEGTHTVSYYAVDGAGNRSDAQAVIHIDDTAPVIDAPDVTVEATGAKTPVTLAATASDLVDGSVAVTYTLENGGPLDPGGFTIGSHELTAHASDAVGNTATKDFMVTVQDTTAR